MHLLECFVTNVCIWWSLAWRISSALIQSGNCALGLILYKVAISLFATFSGNRLKSERDYYEIDISHYDEEQCQKLHHTRSLLFPDVQENTQWFILIRDNILCTCKYYYAGTAHDDLPDPILLFSCPAIEGRLVLIPNWYPHFLDQSYHANEENVVGPARFEVVYSWLVNGKRNISCVLKYSSRRRYVSSLCVSLK